MTRNDVLLPSSLSLPRGKLPLAATAAAEVATGRINPVPGRFGDRHECSTGPRTAVIVDVDLDHFAGSRTINEHGLPVDAPDSLSPMRHLVNGYRRHGRTSSRISTSDPCIHDR